MTHLRLYINSKPAYEEIDKIHIREGRLEKYQRHININEVREIAMNGRYRCTQLIIFF